ncbi:MAG: MFS transporter [Pseudomonadota bacterium]
MTDERGYTATNHHVTTAQPTLGDRGYLAIALLGVFATLVLITLPVFVAELTSDRDWSDTRLGWLASMDLGAGALASTVLFPFVDRLPWQRTARISLVLVIVGNLACSAAFSFTILLVLRFAVGFANGIILVLVFVTLSNSSHPDRFFGVYVFAQLLLQATMLLLIPTISGTFGANAIFLTFALCSAMTFPLINSLPLSPTSTATEAETFREERISAHLKLPQFRVIIALAAQALYFLAPAALWSYLEPIGVDFSIAKDQINHALALSALFGVAGAVAAIQLAEVQSRLAAMAAGTLLSLLSVLLFLYGSGSSLFTGAVAVFSFAWNFTFPFQMGVIAALDPSGRAASLSLTVQLAGLGVGPALVAISLSLGATLDAVITISGIVFVAAFILFLGAVVRLSERNMQRSTSPLAKSNSEREGGGLS